MRANRICAGVNCASAPKKYASPSVALHQQRAHELGRLGRPAADDGFPGRLGGVPTGHAQSAVGDAQPRRRGREGSRITLGHFRDEIGLGRKPRARRVVQGEKPVVQQRRVARSDDGACERLRRRAAAEHGVDPDRGGQRKRHRLGRGGISSGLAVSRLRQGWARTGGGVQRSVRLQVRGIEARQECPERLLARIGLDANRRVVGTADQVEEELTAIGGRAVVNGGQRRAQAARQRHLAESAGRGPAPGGCAVSLLPRRGTRRRAR